MIGSAAVARVTKASVSLHAFEAQHLAGEARRRRPGRSCSMKYSSTSPSTRPPGRARPARRARRGAPTRRTLIIGASTMVPAFMRYCWAKRGWAMRRVPSRRRLQLGVALVGLAARSRRSETKSTTRSNVSRVEAGVGRGRAHLARRARRDRRRRRRPCRGRAGRARRARPCARDVASCAPASAASSAARHSSTSKRLDGHEDAPARARRAGGWRGRCAG